MRVRRLLAAVLTTGLIAPTAAVVATSAPAAAATATQIVSGSEGRSWLHVNKYSGQGAAVYKRDTISLSINVADAAGKQVYDGGLTVQRKLKGKTAWKTVATSSSAYLYDTLKVLGTASYRVLYAGNAEYAPTSAQGSVKAQRDVDINGISGRKTGFEGKLSPKAKVKIIVKKKVGKKWRKFRTAATNSKGRFRVVLPAPGRRGAKFRWQITFKGSKGFAATKITGTTYRI